MIGIKKVTLQQRMKWVGLFCFYTVFLFSDGIGQMTSPAFPGGLSGINGDLSAWFRPEQADCQTFSCPIVSIITARRGTNPTLGSASGTVTHNDEALNFNPAITTNNGWMDFDRKWPSGPETKDEMSLIVVFSTTNPTVAGSKWQFDCTLIGNDGFSGGAPYDRFALKMRAGLLEWGENSASNTPRFITSATYNDGKPHVVVINRRRSGSATTDAEMFVDGASVGRWNSADVDFDNIDKMVLGADSAKFAGSFFNGKFGDVMFYRDSLLPGERERIETYAALKYGIPLPHDYRRLGGAAVNGRTVYELDGVFNFGIIGVARCDSALLYQRATSSSSDPTGFALYYGAGFAPAFPTINDSASTVVIPNNTYQIVGHDNGATSYTKSIGTVPNCKLARTFKVTDIGNAGPVTLWFDDAEYDIGTGTYYLCTGRDPGMGVGERFLPLTPDGSGGHYVEVDFPNNDTTFFTLTNANSFSAPANIARGLELWLRSDTGIVGTFLNISSWNDWSGNDHHVSAAPGTASYAPAPTNINYHADFRGGAVVRQWQTPRFRGRTIVAVGKASGAQQWDGYMGFNGDKGLRKTTTGTSLLIGDTNNDDWSIDPNGDLRSNGFSDSSAALRDFSVILGERDSVWNRERFYVGGYFGTRAFDTYDFAEILVYDTTLSPSQKEKIESYLALKYGVTLRHPYYASNWTGTIGVTYYDTTGGYSQEIAGIGRDDAGRLLQKQGRSSLTTSVVSLALSAHQAYDSLNLVNFEADMKFMVAGHNRVNDSCWSTLDISVPLEAGIHQRIPREWKMMYSGTWSTDSVQLRMFDNVVGYNMPPLPSGSTAYYLYMDPDNNFANGGTIALPMTSPSAGIWQVNLDPGVIPPSPFFFTFGTKLDSITHGHLVRCKGNEFKVFGSMLAQRCTALSLVDGATVYRADIGTLANTKFEISTDLPGACVDTLRWMAPTNALAGTYRLLVDTLSTPTGCLLSTFSVWNNNKGGLVREVQIDTGEVADISWPGDSIYCSNDPNVMPIVGPNCSPGVFSYSSGPLLPSNTGMLLPNTTTGQLLVHQGSAGTHTIKFVTNGGSACIDSSDAIIKIRPVGTPTISYANSPYCGGTALSDTVVIVGTKGGRFSSSPGLVFDDTLTGRVNLPASAPGTYTVFYTPHPDSCANVASTTIVVDAPERAYFNYPDTVMCLGGAAELPLIQYRPVTGGFSTAPGSPGPLLVINAPSGTIDLNASQAGTYYIQYSGITGTCIYDAMDTIRIKAPTDATFTLANDTLCLNDPAFIPNRTDPNGYFTSFNNLIGILVDSLTINPPTSTVGGPYNLIYIVPDTFCSDTTALPMFFRGLAAASLTYTDTVVCENSPNPMPVFNTGIAGGIFYSTNGGIIVDSMTGEFNASSTPVGVGYNVFYIVPDPSCPDTVLAATINIDSIPNPYFDLAVDSLCEGSGPYEFDVLRPSGYNLTLFIGANPFNGATSGDTLNVNSLPPGGPYMIRNIQSNAACQDTAYDFITIVEQDSAGIIFTPDIICLNDNNPFPLITGVGGGTFSLGPSPSFVVVDPDSGIMTLDSNTVLGIYSVIYQTVGLCADRDTAYVDIRNNISAQFDYDASEYCQSDSGLISPEPGFALGGAFDTDSSGLVWVDSILGVFDLGASEPGTYVIEYEISNAGACEAKWTDRLVIVEEDTITTLAYAGSPYCPSDPDPNPILTNSVDSLGLYSGTGVYFTNQDLGIISLAATLPGSYTVFFEKLTVCREVFSFPIVIKPAAQAYFSYPSSIYCIGPDNVFPDSISSLGGSFFYRADSSNDALDINTGTGEIRLETSNEGNYFIDYTIPPSGIICGGTSSFEIRILARPDGIELISNHNNDTFCENTFIQFDAAGADLVTFYLNGDSVGSGTSWEGIGLDSADVVQAYFTTGLGCRDSITRTMHVFDIPEANLLSSPSILSGRDSLDIQVELLTDNTWLDWSVTGIGAVRFTQNSGRSAEGDSSDVVPLGNTVFLDSDFDPAQFTYTIIPRTFLCTGQPLTANIRVNPNEKDVFVPQVITPDGNNQNDTWFIQLKNGIDPANYTIKLFNSAGALVHTMTPLNDTFNGDVADAGYLSDGVYWYLLFNEKGEKVEAGGLTIRRK